MKALYPIRRNNDPLPPHLPAPVRAYFEDTALPANVDWERIKQAQELFATFGAEMLLILGLYALPSAFAAAKGVKVLHRTANLERNPMRRLWETCQFVLDVLEPGGLMPTGCGIRSAQKVRLFHAQVRYRLLTRWRPRPEIPPPPVWDSAALGVPVNQEDLAGTLTEFGFIVLDGLARLGIELRPKEQEDYLYTWSVVGGVLGVDDELRPETVARAKELAGTISRRQITGPSEEGQAITKKLLEAFEGKVPWPFKSMPKTFLRLFLSSDPYQHRDIAAMLGVTHGGWTDTLVPMVQFFSREHDKLFDRLGTSSLLVRWLSRHFLDLALQSARTGDQRAHFYLRDKMRNDWRSRERQKRRGR